LIEKAPSKARTLNKAVSRKENSGFFEKFQNKIDEDNEDDRIVSVQSHHTMGNTNKKKKDRFWFM
jgi:hypothetical protein